MKPTRLLLISFLLVNLLFTSCTEENATKDKLVQSMVDIATDGSATTSVFSYNENRITSINQDNVTLEFTYTNDLITSTVETNAINQIQITTDYFYSNGNLIKLLSSENYAIYYTHQSNGTIGYEKKAIDGLGNETLVLHGTMTFENENLIKDYSQYDDTPITTVAKKKLDYVYNTSKNPLYNILGFKKLVNYGNAISKNNSTKEYETNSEDYLDTNQSISGIEQLIYSIQFDADNYPVERIAENPLMVVRAVIPNYSKTLFNY